MRQTATAKGVKAINLFIAELNGFKRGISEQAKEQFGRDCYLNSTLHDIDPMTEKGRKDLHENIWLERLYKELDAYYQVSASSNITKRAALAGDEEAIKKIFGNPSTSHKWTVPIELDASASMQQVYGILLNDSRLMEATNIIGTAINDPWHFDGISRAQFKEAATPMLYGSAAGCHQLWAKAGYKYTLDQVNSYNKELTQGGLGVANMFKDFLINNSKPTPTMQVNINNEIFTIECNKFRNVGEQTKSYKLYDSEDHQIRTVRHTTTKKVPDLDQFRRYFATLLVHNLDGQIANRVIDRVLDKHKWGFAIHDAFIVDPEAAEDCRAYYGEEINKIHSNRTQILAKYFESIGIDATANQQWKDIKDKVVPYEGTLNCRAIALK